MLALWSGLGYYRRARHLHAAARAVCERHGGELPASEEALRALPGIGEYTAAAIAAIAFGVRTFPLDGNGARVMARLHAVEGAIDRPDVRVALRARGQALTPAGAGRRLRAGGDGAGRPRVRARDAPVRDLSRTGRVCGARRGQGGAPTCARPAGREARCAHGVCGDRAAGQGVAGAAGGGDVARRDVGAAFGRGRAGGGGRRNLRARAGRGGPAGRRGSAPPRRDPPTCSPTATSRPPCSAWALAVAPAGTPAGWAPATWRRWDSSFTRKTLALAPGPPAGGGPHRAVLASVLVGKKSIKDYYRDERY